MKLVLVCLRDWIRRAFGAFWQLLGHPLVPTPEPNGREISVPPPAGGSPVTTRKTKEGSTEPVVTIGLDYGTFSTKVLVRRRGEDEATLLKLDEPTQGYPDFVLPSDVRIAEGRLFFGREARSRDTDKIYTPLKLGLIRPSSQADMGDGNHRPEVLVAAYFSWALQLVRRELDRRFGEGAYRPYLNVAAPMDHIEDGKRKERYLRVVAAAWNSVFHERSIAALQGSDAAVLDAIDRHLETAVVPAIGERLFEVLPENLAPLVSLAQQPRMTPGMYLVVDMGAGSTELSINRVHSPNEDIPVLCYCDRSVSFGARSYGDPLAVRPTIERLLREARCTWGEGFEKVKGNFDETKDWRDLNILLAGGGTQHPDVRPAFLRYRSEIFYIWAGDGTLEAERYQPEGIEHPGTDRDYFRRHSYLLAVAHGLSIERQHWPEFCRPFEIKPAPPTPETDKGYNWQDDPGS
jgi:hypothetical protein